MLTPNLFSSYQKLHPKLQNVIIDFHVSNDRRIRHPFYSNFLGFVNIWETTNIDTFAVNITVEGMNLYYNRDFLETLSDEAIRFILIHEIYHLLFNHPKRTIQNGFNPELSNLVQDWIINEIILQNHSTAVIAPPKDKDGKNIGVFLPKEYDGPLVYEALYIWALEQQEKQKDNKDSESNNSNDSDYGDFGKSCQTWSLKKQLEQLKEESKLKTFDKHLENTVLDDFAQEKVKTIVEKLSNRGLVNGNMEYILDVLIKKPGKNPLKRLKSLVANASFKRESFKTYRKLSRRDEEGIKGKKKIGNTINVLLDTSGSMSSEFVKILGYLLDIGSEINLVQCDTKIHEFKKITKNSQIKNIKIKGLGGTILQPGIDYFKDNKMGQYPLAILTDGYTDTLNLSGFPKTIILYTEKECPTISNVEQYYVGKK